MYEENGKVMSKNIQCALNFIMLKHFLKWLFGSELLNIRHFFEGLIHFFFFWQYSNIVFW